MSYTIKLTTSAEAELKAIRVYDRRQILDVLKAQLTHQPTMETRNRKRLDEVAPPIWELCIGDYRVFYDVAEDDHLVVVRAVRAKQHGQTTEEVLREASNS